MKTLALLFSFVLSINVFAGQEGAIGGGIYLQNVETKETVFLSSKMVDEFPTEIILVDEQELEKIVKEDDNTTYSIDGISGEWEKFDPSI